MKQRERLAAASIAVGIAVLALKAVAWRLTGSAALYSDALESVVNVAASAVAWWTLVVAARPADANHPYGHDKAEFFSAVIEGVLIVVAALLILQHAWVTFRAPTLSAAPWAGLVLNALATMMNGAWAAVLLRRGRQLRSPALLGDGRHLFADVITSTGVVAGVALAALTGILVLDPLLAAATAVHILWSGVRMVRESLSGLMDEAPNGEIMERIRNLVSTHAEGALEAHDLRTRHAGRLTFLEFHLVVPGTMRVDEAHAICDRIEAALKAEMEGLVITIHVEPEAKAKHQGVLVL
ncbi:MAG TPA: cation diffusion facilitator family transporter [Acetobacteraceae bacterium]|nr:cation diffusion facilitator family transporter [Acetobacteraceae bacterium]